MRMIRMHLCVNMMLETEMRSTKTKALVKPALALKKA